MAKKENQFVQEITPRDVDFAKWYTDIVLKNDMCDYTDVRGCMAIKPYGYAVWELMQKEMDQRFKDTGHQNAYFPLLIPESMLMKEAEHVEGFAPEVAWVTGRQRGASGAHGYPTHQRDYNRHHVFQVGTVLSRPARAV